MFSGALNGEGTRGNVFLVSHRFVRENEKEDSVSTAATTTVCVHTDGPVSLYSFFID